MAKFFVAISVSALFIASAFAQPALPPLSLYKVMAEANKATGWVAFREYDGKQWIYFTPLVTLHCRVSDVRYSINSDALDVRFSLPACVPALPFSLPSDAGPEAIAIQRASGEAKIVHVQVVFDDGSESEIVRFSPCDGVGDATCAQPAP